MRRLLNHLVCIVIGHRDKMIEINHEFDDYPFWSETCQCARCGRQHEVF